MRNIPQIELNLCNCFYKLTTVSLNRCRGRGDTVVTSYAKKGEEVEEKKEEEGYYSVITVWQSRRCNIILNMVRIGTEVCLPNVAEKNETAIASHFGPVLKTDWA